jgi:hypothetical protein
LVESAGAEEFPNVGGGHNYSFVLNLRENLTTKAQKHQENFAALSSNGVAEENSPQ